MTPLRGLHLDDPHRSGPRSRLCGESHSAFRASRTTAVTALLAGTVLFGTVLFGTAAPAGAAAGLAGAAPAPAPGRW